jgi:Kef-type K+ transport system membrane component KefB
MSETLQLILQLALLIFVTKAAGLVSMRLKQPAVLGELVAGLIMGPTLLNMFHWSFFTSTHGEDIVLELAELGVILLMFMAGLEVDLTELLGSGRVAMSAGSLGVVVPFLLGGGLALLFSHSVEHSIFIGLILTATSVSISAQTLLELGVIKRREGVAMLGSAVVDDVLVILLLSIFLAVTGSGGAGSVLNVIISMVLFFAIAIPVGLWVLPTITQHIRRLPISEGVLSWTIVVTLLFAFAAEAFGQVAAITGAFLAGIFFGRTRIRHEINQGMHTIAYAFFVPLFLVSIGLKVNVRDMDSTALVFMIALTLIAIISKVIGAGLGAKVAGMTLDESLRVGIGMVSRGEVGLIVATIGLELGLIDENVFAATVLMVFLTTLITPFLLRRVFPRENDTVNKEIVDGDKLVSTGD